MKIPSFQVSNKVRLHPAWDGVACRTRPRLRSGTLYCVRKSWRNPTNGLHYVRLAGIEASLDATGQRPGLCALAFVPVHRGKEAA